MNAFHWRGQPSIFCPKERSAQTIYSSDRYHASKEGLSVAEYRAKKTLGNQPASNQSINTSKTKPMVKKASI